MCLSWEDFETTQWCFRTLKLLQNNSLGSNPNYTVCVATRIGNLLPVLQIRDSGNFYYALTKGPKFVMTVFAVPVNVALCVFNQFYYSFCCMMIAATFLAIKYEYKNLVGAGFLSHQRYFHIRRQLLC